MNVVADGSGFADLLDAINQSSTYLWNLIRWVSPRAIKESFVPPRDWRYPFLVSDPA
jgi:1-pyrroline-5-carboxylate dehydrogenase